MIYLGVNAFSGTGLAPQAVRGQECGGAAGPGWARPGAAAAAMSTGVRDVWGLIAGAEEDYPR